MFILIAPRISVLTHTSVRPIESHLYDLTIEEANDWMQSALAKMEKLNGDAHKASIKISGQPKTPVSRAQLVDAFNRLELNQEPNFQLWVRSQYMDPKILTLTGSAKKKAEKLIIMGFVAPSGPLVCGNSGFISVEDAGDAFGYFISRWAQYTHESDVKWSPDLENGNS